MRNPQDETLAVDLLTKNSPESFEKLLNQTDINKKVGPLNRNLLHTAIVFKAKLEIIRILLEKMKSKINEADDNGLTPVHLAAIHGNLPVIELLLTSGANPNLQVLKDDIKITDLLKKHNHANLIPKIKSLKYKHRCQVLESHRLRALKDQLKPIQLAPKQLFFVKSLTPQASTLLSSDLVQEETSSLISNIPKNTFYFQVIATNLDALKKLFLTNKRVAIIGPTGCGKTELVKHYAQYFIGECNKKSEKNDVPVTWTFDATTSETLFHNSLALLQRLNIFFEQYEGESNDELDKRIISCLNYHLNNKNCLFIFDNVSQYKTVENYSRFLSANTQIIITSQTNKFPDHIQSFILDKISINEAVNILKYINPALSEKELNILPIGVGLSPMVLAMTAFIIKYAKMSCKRFLELMKKKKLENSNSNALHIIGKIFLEHIDDEVLQLIKVCSLLHYQKIPYVLLKNIFEKSLQLNPLLKKLETDLGIIQLHLTNEDNKDTSIESISFYHPFLLTIITDHLKAHKEAVAKWIQQKDSWLATKKQEWLTARERDWKKTWSSLMYSFDMQANQTEYSKTQGPFDEQTYLREHPKPRELLDKAPHSGKITTELGDMLITLLSKVVGFSEKAAILTRHLEVFFKNVTVPDIESFYNLLGCAHFILFNDTRKASAYFDKTIHSTNAHEAIKSHNNKAVVLLKLNNLAQASQLLESALKEISEPVNDIYLDTFNKNLSVFLKQNLGIVYFLIGNFKLAYDYFFSGFETCYQLKNFNSEKLLKGLLCANKGLAAYAGRDHKIATSAYEEAEEILKSIQIDSKFLTNLYFLQAMLLHSNYTKKDDLLALEKLELGLSLLKNTVNQQYIVLSIFAADICINLKNYNKGSLYYELAKTTIEKLGGDSISLAEALNNQGVADVDANKFAQALANFEKALTLGENAFSQSTTRKLFLDIVRSNKDDIRVKTSPRIAKLADTKTKLRWHIPSLTTTSITRNKLLNSIKRLLTKEPICAITQKTSGSIDQGFGKTQLAIQYVKANQQNYQIAIWFNGDYIANEFREFAQEVLHKKTEGLSNEEATEMVWNEFKKLDQWLIVIDNVTNYASIKTFLPPQELLFSDKTKKRHIVIISNTPNWKTFVSVDVFHKTELTKYVKQPVFEHEPPTQVFNLFTTLSSFPIVTSQVYAYIKETQSNAEKYLNILNNLSEKDMEFFCGDSQQKPKESPYPTLFLKALVISLKELQKNPFAIALLKFFAYLDLEYVPQFLFTELTDSTSYVSAMFQLKNYAIINVSGEKRIFIHKLFLILIQSALRYKNNNIWLKTPDILLVQVLSQFKYEKNSPNEIKKIINFLPYIQRLIKNVHQRNEINENMLPILLAVSKYYLIEQQNFNESLPLLDLGLECAQKLLSNLTTDFLNYLGYAYYLKKDIEHARELLSKSIKKSNNRLQDINSHLNLALAHQILGHTYYAEGNYEEAKTSYQQAVHHYDLAYEKKPHLDTAISYRYLADAYYKMFIHASNHSSDPYHPAATEFYKITRDMLIALTNPECDQQLINTYLHWGNVYFFKAEFDEAEKQYMNALNIKTNQPNNSKLISTYCNLANTNFMKKNYAKAKQNYERALLLQEKFYKDGFHLTTIKILLGFFYINYLEADHENASKYIKRGQEMLAKHPNLDSNSTIKDILLSKLKIKTTAAENLCSYFLDDLFVLEKLDKTIIFSPNLELSQKDHNISSQEEKKSLATTYVQVSQVLSNEISPSPQNDLIATQKQIQKNYQEFEKSNQKKKAEEDFSQSLETLDLSPPESPAISDDENEDENEKYLSP